MIKLILVAGGFISLNVLNIVSVISTSTSSVVNTSDGNIHEVTETQDEINALVGNWHKTISDL